MWGVVLQPGSGERDVQVQPVASGQVHEGFRRENIVDNRH